MEKNLNFNHLPDLDDILSNREELKDLEVNVENVDPQQSLLRIIYAVGEDGWPIGDLAYFVGNKANPEVQRFILDNLMRDVSGARNPANMNLSDEEITILTRQSNETNAQYVSRLNASIDKDKMILDYAKRAVQANKVPKQPTK